MSTLTLALVILGACAWIQAQDQTTPGQSGSHSAGISTGKTTKVEGCLQGSDGNYTLTDNSGTYRLQGDTSKLADHVGHEMQIMGTLSEGSAEASNTAAGSPQTVGTIDVKNFKHISKTCKMK